MISFLFCTQFHFVVNVRRVLVRLSNFLTSILSTILRTSLDFGPPSMNLKRRRVPPQKSQLGPKRATFCSFPYQGKPKSQEPTIQLTSLLLTFLTLSLSRTRYNTLIVPDYMSPSCCRHRRRVLFRPSGMCTTRREVPFLYFLWIPPPHWYDVLFRLTTGAGDDC